MAEVTSAPLDSQAQAPVAVFKKRGAKSQSNLRKRVAEQPESDSGSEYSSEDEAGRKIKRRRKAGVLTASSKSSTQHSNTDNLKPTQFAADTTTPLVAVNDATKSSDWYEEQAGSTKPDDLSAKNLLGSAAGTYKGAANYDTYRTANPNAPAKPKVGPVKAAANVRTITITDFAPDVCKDYKQTGFCGFGDNCKYLHAREDYKQGWELDKEWEKVGKDKKAQGRTVSSRGGEADADDEEAAEDALLEGIPFACILCKKPYTNPIVTKCGHYFCEKCALQRFRKTPSCAACGAGTGGVFNGAKQLKKLLEKKRERARKRREKAIAAGEEVSSADEDEAASAD